MKDRLLAVFTRAREARPALDHLVRMQQRMSKTRGSMLAGSVTYSAFLSIGPLLLLAVSVLGFVLAGNDSAQQSVLQDFQKVIPGDLSKNLLDGVQSSRGATGIVGVVTAGVPGLGWLTTLKTALQVVWHQDAISQNALLSRLQDALTLVGFAVLLVLSTALSSSASGAAKGLAHAIAGPDAPALSVVLTVLGLVLAIGANVLLFLFVYQRLSVVNRPRRTFVRGSLISAVGVWALQTVLFFVVAHTLSSSSQTYGAVLGGVFALLLYIRYITLIMMYSAAWMATAPYRDDVLPSGTALVALSDDEAARALPTKRAKAEDVRQEVAQALTGSEVALPGGGTAPRPVPLTKTSDAPPSPSGADEPDVRDEPPPAAVLDEPPPAAVPDGPAGPRAGTVPVVHPTDEGAAPLVRVGAAPTAEQDRDGTPALDRLRGMRREHGGTR